MKKTLILVLVAVAVCRVELRAESRNAENPVNVTGTVVVRAEPEFAVIGVAPQGGGRVEHLFVFWPRVPLERRITRYEHAQVKYTGQAVSVSVPADKTLVTFAVEGLPAGPSPVGFTGTTFAGFGLNHQIGAGAERFAVTGGPRGRGESVSTPKASTAMCYLDGTCEEGSFALFADAAVDTGGTRRSCDHGGLGSSACSYSKDGSLALIGGGTGCSVTCMPGYYACCYSTCLFSTCTISCRCFPN